MAAGLVRHRAALLAILFIASGIAVGSKYRGKNDVRRGEAFNITCVVAINEGVSWTKDGRNLTKELGPFSVDERKMNESVEATLTVQKARVAHAGSYQCSGLHKSEKHAVRVAADAQLTGVYDKDNLRGIDHTKHSFNLTCKVADSAPKDAKVEWLKEGKDVSNETRFTMSRVGDSAVLLMKPVQEDDIGNYTCRLQSEPTAAASFVVYGKPFVHLSSPNHNVVEGQKIKIACTVLGKPSPNVYWQYDNGSTNVTVTPELEGRISLNKSDSGVENSLLVLTDAQLSDHGVYRCVGYQPLGDVNSTDSTTLRVKDRYAALWPFIGICAEVVVLCAIILVYEKRRSKNTDMDDSDTDNHDQKKS